MKKARFGCFASCSVFLISLVVAGCSSSNSSPSSSATVSAVIFGGTASTLGTPAAEWNSASIGLGEVEFLSSDNLESTVVAVSKGNSDASVYICKAIPNATPSFPNTPSDSATLKLYDGVYVYVKVVAEDNTSTLVYKFKVKQPNSNAKIISLTVSGITASSFGIPAATWNDSTLELGSLAIFSNAATSAPVVVTPGETTSTIKYAVVSGTAEPTFGDTATFTFSDGDFLYLKVTAADGTTNIYKIKVTVLPTLESVTIAGVTATLGISDSSYANALSSAVRLGGAADATNVLVSVTKTNATSSVRYGTSASAGVEPTNWGGSATLAGTLDTASFIGIEITSSAGTKNYYVFQVLYGDAVATAASISVHGISETLPTPASSFAGATQSSIYLTSAELVCSATVPQVVAVPTSSKSLVEYGISTSGAPTAWNTTGIFGTNFSDGTAPTCLTVRVTSEDKGTVNWYVFGVYANSFWGNSWNADVASIAFSTGGGTVNCATLGTPSSTWDHAQIVAGSLALTAAQAANITAIAPSLASSPWCTSAYTYAKVSGLGTPSFSSTAPTSLADGDVLYLTQTQTFSYAPAVKYVQVYKLVVSVN